MSSKYSVFSHILRQIPLKHFREILLEKSKRENETGFATMATFQCEGGGSVTRFFFARKPTHHSFPPFLPESWEIARCRRRIFFSEKKNLDEVKSAPFSSPMMMTHSSSFPLRPLCVENNSPPNLKGKNIWPIFCFNIYFGQNI